MRKLLFRIRPSGINPITEDGKIDFRDIEAVVLKNAGTATVNLWGGLYTLDSKETIALNVTQVDTNLDLIDIPVSFDTSTGLIKKLQVLIMKATVC